MRIHKLIVLGIDCLDWYLIQKWNLREYILRVSGRHFVGYDLYTPVIWAKFLTGIDVTKFGFNSKRLSLMKRIKGAYYANLLKHRIEQLTSRFKNKKGGNSLNSYNYSNLNEIQIHTQLINTLIHGCKSENLRELLLLKLFAKSVNSERIPKKLRDLTFVKYAESLGFKVYVFQFPPLNDDIYALIRNMLYFIVESDYEMRRKVINKVSKITYLSLKLLEKVIDTYDIILWYSPIIDLVSHLLYKPKDLKSMVKLYIVYKNLGSEIKKTILNNHSEDGAILIVSDHGFNPKICDHSHYGFWSLNISTLSKFPVQVTDFKEIIIKDIIDRLS